jgi:hypothetical protein
MTVSVVNVRHVRVRVPHRAVLVEMSVRFARWIEGAVRVTMVFVMDMWMRMRHRRVNVFVFVTLGEVQPDAQCHETARRQELKRDGLRQRHDRRYRPHEWRRAEVGRRACAAEMAQRQDEQHDAQAVANKPDTHRNQ